MLNLKKLSIVLAWHLALCSAAVSTSASDLQSDEYDFVIIGGGTAGNVLANRLTENPHHSVLVLEAGATNIGAFETTVPFFAGRLLGSIYSWNYTTVAQEGLNGRTTFLPQGFGLGGSSAINGMFYTRGSSEDYDRYATSTGDSGWSWNNLQPYIRKNEKWTQPADGHNTTGQFDPSAHSFTGINRVSLQGFTQATDEKIIQTTKELSAEFPYVLDMNAGQPLGLGWLQTTIGAGQRSSSATSYLGPEFRNRPNLHILLHAQVTRILPSGSTEGGTSFKTVEFAQGTTGPRRRVSATKEVIVSAGAVGTPHLLMNSGIGDKAELTALGIRPLFHLPDVGKNLTDHLLILNNWIVNGGGGTFDEISRNASVTAEVLAQWNTSHQGPLVDTTSSHLFYGRIPDNTTQLSDPSAGPNTPHFELSISNGFLGAIPSVGEFFSIITVLVSPASRGTIRLNTSNPFDQALVNPGFLSAPYDIVAMREALRAARRFLTAPTWENYILEPFGPLAPVTDDDDSLDDYIRNNAESSIHPVGTSKMSPKGANYGVVDPDLRVKGIPGLRIVDSSVLPFVPSAHPQAAVYAIAERAADLIKKDWP